MINPGRQKINQGHGQLLKTTIPLVIGPFTIVIAVLGAILTGESNPSVGVNGFVESISGNSSAGLTGVAPLGIFALAAGMVATVNPCGFAMLPAYLGLYMGSFDSDPSFRNPLHRLSKALLVSSAVSAGFILLFGVAGLIVFAGVESIGSFIGWVGLSVGIILTIGGSWALRGGALYFGLPSRAASRMGNPGQVNVLGYFMFGLSYGVASLSCTLPIFLSVVGLGATLTSSTALNSIFQFVLYGLGMGLVIVLLTIGIAIFKEVSLGFLRAILPFVQMMGAVLLIVAGAYIVYYWLTIGGLMQ